MKVKAKLRYLGLRGETTSTQWGDVSFDRDGLAELEVPEEDLHLLRNLKWLVEEPVVEAQEPPALPDLPPEPVVEAQEPPPLPGLPPEPAGLPQVPADVPLASASPNDTTTPPQGTKKRRG